MTVTLPTNFAHQLRGELLTCLTAVALAVASIAASSTDAAAVRMQAPGSRVSMDLPEKFKSSPLFAGFMEVISSAAVITRELPADAHEKVVAGFSAEALGKKGITGVKVGKLERTGSYFYVTGEQKHSRALFAKSILVIRDDKNTAVITFNVPKGAFASGALKREQVITALTSVRLEAAAAPSRDLFKLGYLGPFSLTGQPTGTSRIYTIKDDKGPKDARDIMMISPSINRLPVRDIGEFSKYALTSLTKNQGLKIQSTKDVRIDGMVGQQITATAKRGAGKTPVLIRQIILLPKNGGYFRLLAISRAAEETRLGAEIEKVFGSFKAVSVQPE